MAQAKGSNAQLLGGVEETTFGSDPAAVSAINLPILSTELAADQPNIETQVIRSRRDSAKPSKGNISAGGQIVVPLDIDNIGYWLWMLLGDATSNQSVSPYVHVFDVGDSIPSFVLEQGYPDISHYQKFNGCKLNSMALNFDAAAEAELTATLQVLAKSETTSSVSMDAAPSEHAFTRFEIGDLVLLEGGASISIAASLNMTISNNLDGSTFVIGGSGQVHSLPEGICSVNGVLTCLFENDTLYEKAVNSTESSIKATLTTGSYSLELLINELIYGRHSPGIPGPQGINVTLPFSAYYDDKSPDVTIFQATLINTVSAFA